MGDEPHLQHPCLMRTADGGPPEQASLSDQERIAVILQAAALLAHLEHGGWYLPDGFKHVKISDKGLLQEAGPIRRGRASEQPQASLLRLLSRLFRGKGLIAGRGEARRAARQLQQLWHQSLVPTPLDTSVAEILETASFLWLPAFGEARRALVAEHRHTAGDSYLWLAGPGFARRRLLPQGTRRQEVEALLASPRAQAVWEGWEEDRLPAQLEENGRWRQAVMAWQKRRPLARREALAYARCLFALGRYSQTLATLKGHSSVAARVLRAWCQLYLGELHAAQNTVRHLEKKELPGEETVALASVAIRIHAALGRFDRVRFWASRALAESRGKAQLEARLRAVGAAWDCGDETAMDRHLEAARGAMKEPDLAWLWHHMRSLRSLAAGDGPGVVEHVSEALRLRRRQLLRAEAARLWNDLAVGQVLADDLPAAERACRHALRLFSGCEGPGRSTLALYNLAEVRLRRGRTRGVEQALERSTTENRRSGNIRGLILDLELWVRFELVHGRSVAALARTAEALQQFDREHLAARRDIFELLAARAQGWLGRGEQAAACLERIRPTTLAELEPEERPAIYALAGQWEQAAMAATKTPWQSLWSALAADLFPGSDTWELLSTLEPYRAARLIFDCELLKPGVVPPSWVRRAISTFRRIDAEDLAERLESRSLSPWRALGRYLERPRGDLSATADLLRQAGFQEARLSWVRRGGQERILVSGHGGDTALSAQLEHGELVLCAPSSDTVLKTIFSVIHRDLRLPGDDVPSYSISPTQSGIIGDSDVLKGSLERLDRLAGGDLPVLILGESGCGKELFARRAHQLSNRSKGPYLAVNCAALSETLILSELFGHVKGAFTGADRNHQGLFEAARGGSIFLDEIGDLPAAAQGKLLRVLQEGEIRRVGESFARKVDVRIVAATHRDLEQMVKDSRFRQDLFFRLKVATIRLPPLRDRGKDILTLADYFLNQRPTSTKPKRLTSQARNSLLSYSWPGNIRELRNILDVASMLTMGDDIRPEHLDLPKSTQSTPRGDYHQQIEAFRRKLVAKALEQAGGNRSEAARQLGLTRQALSYLARQLDLS